MFNLIEVNKHDKRETFKKLFLISSNRYFILFMWYNVHINQKATGKHNTVVRGVYQACEEVRPVQNFTPHDCGLFI